MTSCRDILTQISGILGVGINIKNTADEQINPATEDTLSKNFPPLYFSEKVEDASTSDVTVTPGIHMTKISLINLSEVEIIFALGEATGTEGTDIILPANASISLNHDGIDFISYKGVEESGTFIYIIQGTETSS
jgi:hypothetical protein